MLKVVLARISILLCILAVLSLTGCTAHDRPPAATADSSSKINSPQGMVNYLQRLNLPALKNAEVWPGSPVAGVPGLKLTTEHYEIFTTLLDPLILSQMPAFMESAYQGYNSQLAEPVEVTSRFTIYLFAERTQWVAFTKDFAGALASVYCRIKAGAYYLNGSCVAYNIGRERTFSAVAHEGWHQFNGRCFRYRLPSWLDEGTAMLFEIHIQRQGLFYFEPAQNLYRLVSLKKTLADNKMMPLKELIAMNPGEVLDENSDTRLMAFYGQAYALVRFLKEDGYGRWQADYNRLLSDGLKGSWNLPKMAAITAENRNIPLTVGWNRAVGTYLFAEYISGDIENIEKDYTAFCRKIVYHVKLK